MAGTRALSDGAHDHAHTLGHGELLHDIAQTGSLLGIVNLARNTELLGIRHEHQIAASQRDVGGHTRALGADRPLGDLNHDLRTHRVNAGDVLGCDFFGLIFLLSALALNLLQTGVESGGNGVPKVQEGVLFQSDVHEHGLEALLDVFDTSLEDATDNIHVAFALHGVFFEYAFLKHSDASFKFFDIDDNSVALRGVWCADTEHAFDVVYHGNKVVG